MSYQQEIIGVIFLRALHINLLYGCAYFLFALNMHIVTIELGVFC